MAIDPIQELNAAKLMCSVATDQDSPLHEADREAFSRAAICRGYYACYHLGLIFAKRNGYTVPKSGSVHAKLWSWFKTTYGNADITTDAKAIMKARIAADYHPHRNMTVSCEDIASDTEAFFELIDNEIKLIGAKSQQ